TADHYSSGHDAAPSPLALTDGPAGPRRRSWPARRGEHRSTRSGMTAAEQRLLVRCHSATVRAAGATPSGAVELDGVEQTRHVARGLAGVAVPSNLTGHEPAPSSLWPQAEVTRQRAKPSHDDRRIGG